MLEPYLAARLGCRSSSCTAGLRSSRATRWSTVPGPDEPAVFLLSLKAGGTGLNLTAANHVVHFDRWWNPAVEEQATDRAFRIGRRKDSGAQVRLPRHARRADRRNDRGQEGARERIVGTGEGWLTELSSPTCATDLRAVPGGGVGMISRRRAAGRTSGGPRPAARSRTA